MKKISLVVNTFNNNERFLNNLYTVTEKIYETELKNNAITFCDIDYEKSDELFTLLSKYIIREFEKKILIKIINKNCDCFSKSEKYNICNMALKSLINDEIEDNYEYCLRVESVKNKLKKCFQNSETVSVEGFVNFRLQELEEDFEEVVEECVRDYLLESEYVEFINMIKYFVSVQSTRYFAVEVKYGESVTLYANGKNITEECMEDFKCDTLKYGIDNDDFLLNSLISIAPKRIFIKQKNKVLNDEIKKTLLGVFGDKITITTE